MWNKYTITSPTNTWQTIILTVYYSVFINKIHKQYDYTRSTSKTWWEKLYNERKNNGPFLWPMSKPGTFLLLHYYSKYANNLP